MLTYHGLVEAKRDPRLERNFHTIDQFRAHLRILRSHVVVPPEQVTRAGKGGSRVRVAITFDDGYRNNLLAAELLEEAGLPWGLYVSTGVVGSRSTVWTARLALLLLHGDAPRVDVLDRSWDLTTRRARLEAFQAIRRPAKLLARPERVALLDTIFTQFPAGEEERLLASFPSFAMLGWDDLRTLAGSGVTIGSHGVDHEIHHPDQTLEVVESELQRSRATISAELGVDCRSVAYPNGDATTASRRIAERCGYSMGFTTQEGVVAPGCDPFALPRLDAIGDPVIFARTLLRGSSPL